MCAFPAFILEVGKERLGLERLLYWPWTLPTTNCQSLLSFTVGEELMRWLREVAADKSKSEVRHEHQERQLRNSRPWWEAMRGQVKARSTATLWYEQNICPGGQHIRKRQVVLTTHEFLKSFTGPKTHNVKDCRLAFWYMAKYSVEKFLRSQDSYLLLYMPCSIFSVE